MPDFFIKQRPLTVSQNFDHGRMGFAPVAIVNHTMEGSLGGTFSHFNRPNFDEEGNVLVPAAKRVSAHFGIGINGDIHQYVQLEDTAWANGVMDKIDESLDWLTSARAKNINPNRLTISIEHEDNGIKNHKVEGTQYAATLWLHRLLIFKFNIPVDRQYIIGHNQIRGLGKPDCPGNQFPFDQLLADLSKPDPNHFDPNEPLPPGFVAQEFGPGVVLEDNSRVRSFPTFAANGEILRILNANTILRFVGFTDLGPEFNGGTRWYKIAPQDGGGWIHSKLIG